MEAFLEFIVEQWQYSPFMFITLSILILAIVALVLWLLFLIVDTAFTMEINGAAKVIEKRFIESHTTMTMVSNGKTSTPMYHHHPDSWEVSCEMNGKTDSINVSEKDYLKIPFNQTVNITYSKGRISGGFYLQSIKV